MSIARPIAAALIESGDGLHLAERALSGEPHIEWGDARRKLAGILKVEFSDSVLASIARQLLRHCLIEHAKASRVRQ